MITQPNFLIDPTKINIKQIKDKEMVSLQGQMSKAVWRICPGRRINFVIHHDDTLIGLMGFMSPNMNVGAANVHLNLAKDYKERGKQLRHYLDMCVCVGIQPLSWHWNFGKLVAMIATSKDIADLYYDRYGDELRGITTFSLFGKSCQYNRIYKHIGFTKGNGNEHITDSQFAEIKSWLKDRDLLPKRPGRMWIVKEWNKYQKPADKISLKHGKKRGVYFSDISNKSLTEIVDDWFWRWGLPRYVRTIGNNPPYQSGLD